MKRRDVAAVLLFLTMGLPVVAHASGQPMVQNVDYASVRQGIVNFEAVINTTITSTFVSNPFAVVQKPKGAYLDGYGLTFAFLINIHTAVINTPFGMIQRNNVTPELKQKLIQDLKEKLIRTLQENSDLFKSLGREDRVTIVAYIEDRKFPDEPNANKTIVLSALKKDLDELGHNSDRLKEFRLRMKIREY